MTGHIVVFQHGSLRGHHRHIFDSENDFKASSDSSLHDAISSVVIIEGQWQFFKHGNFNAPYAAILGPGIYRWLPDYGIENDQVSSLKCVG
jgi:hypothetical protein